MRDTSIIFTEMEEYSVDDCRFPVSDNLSNGICALMLAFPRLTILYKIRLQGIHLYFSDMLLSRTAPIVTDNN